MPETTDVATQGTANQVPAPTRTGTALCLSGGGYRAALFHCGAVRRLHELGVLSEVTDVSAVSGGSIFAAHLALNMGALAPGGTAVYENAIAKPFRDFVKNDIRTSAALKRMLPWEWANSAAQSEELEANYDQLLVFRKKLRDLPDHPRFHFCATDLAFGVNWVFTRDKVGDYMAGYMTAADSGEVPLARAVAASSCFPPVFKPMPMSLAARDLPRVGDVPNGPERDECLRELALTDGGVYDNMGLEPVWKSRQTLLVCDGGKPFRFSKANRLPQQLLRITDVVGNQAEALRKRWLIASFVRTVYTGTYWGVGNAVADYEVPQVPGYSKELAIEVISAIRTDMDRFSDDEIGVLENHGYLLAEAAISKHMPGRYKTSLLTPPAPALWPDAATLKTVEAAIRNRLADSADILPLGHS